MWRLGEGRQVSCGELSGPVLPHHTTHTRLTGQVRGVGRGQDGVKARMQVLCRNLLQWMVGRLLSRYNWMIRRRLVRWLGERAQLSMLMLINKKVYSKLKNLLKKNIDVYVFSLVRF